MNYDVVYTLYYEIIPIIYTDMMLNNYSWFHKESSPFVCSSESNRIPLQLKKPQYKTNVLLLDHEGKPERLEIGKDDWESTKHSMC